MIEGWLARVTEHFWNQIGSEITYPLDLSYIISRSFPLSVIMLPQLRVTRVESWFQQQGIPFRFLCQDRSLCGCIIAVRGSGFIFADSSDPDDERRYTIAHEVAHFLLDYLYPRQKVLQLFGDSIRPVLDGERTPTETEMLDALLSRVKLGTYTDLMPRSNKGDIDQAYILPAEEKADRFALELLSPAGQVLSQVALQDPMTVNESTHITKQVLTSVYGLPPTVAKKYSAYLLRNYTQKSMVEWFGL